MSGFGPNGDDRYRPVGISHPDDQLASEPSIPRSCFLCRAALHGRTQFISTLTIALPIPIRAEPEIRPAHIGSMPSTQNSCLLVPLVG